VRIVINATPLLARRSGIGRYIYHLASSLLRLDPGNEYTFFYGYSFGRELRSQPDPAVMAAKAVATRVMKDPWRLREAIHRVTFLMGRLRRGFDLYHEPNYVPLPFPGPLVITVCDLSVLTYPESHPPQRVAWFARGFLPAVKRARRLLTISHYVKQEIVDRLQVDPARIDVTHLAADERFLPVPPETIERVLSARGLPRRYLLTVGTVEPRKNLPTLLRAYARLPASLQEEHPLVVVGMQGWVGDSTHYRDIAALAQQLRLTDRVVFAGYVPDEDLPAIYRGATAFVFPSLYEGFGLPPLEAMACGTPVVCSNAASLPEVVGEAGLLVEPTDVQGFAAAMERVISSQELRSDLSAQALVRARQFSWDGCARGTLATYRAAVL
jgi:glycosyltransferase involved in cell wall biosynthesis